MEDIMNWRKSSYSGSNGAECVEVGMTTGTVVVRDTKDPDGPRLAFAPGAWEKFAVRVKADVR
jgi:hypothetical protein